MKRHIITFIFIVCFSLIKAANIDYVDLGLPSGLKWATCNVGADRPELVGNYYAWGEDAPKKKYVIKNYKYTKMSLMERVLSVFTPALFDLRYITCYPTSGDISVLNLAPEDDVAATILGEGWKIPTKQDYEELIANCTWEVMSVNGIDCLKLTSKVKGYEDKYIVFPPSDLKNDQPGMYRKSYKKEARAPGAVYYWTSTLRSSQSQSSCAVLSVIHSVRDINPRMITALRFIGMPIRPVHY